MAMTADSTMTRSRSMRRRPCLRVRKITTVKTSSTTFFQKVSQLVSLMASPKHPQSSTRSVRASTNVVTVKNAIMAANSQEVSTRKALAMSNTPIRNSMQMRATERTPASGRAHSKLEPKSSQLVI